jgi:aryl-alcohol dehydrogenase-like predicted oxidoreductase
VAQVALAWILSKNAVTSVILGASKLNQLEDNLGVLGVRLEEGEIAKLDAATALAPVYPNWFSDGVGVDQALSKALGL